MSDIRMKGFPSTTSITKALNSFLHRINSISRIEIIDIENGLNKIIAEDIISNVDSPYFDRSAMDGYAVKAEDTVGASNNSPMQLKIIGRIGAGHYTPLTVNSLEAVEIMTGAKVPKGADSVIMIEYTKKINENYVDIFKPVTPGINIDKIGSDIKKGEKILSKGTILKPPDLGVLKALKVKKIKIFPPPKIGIISTGDELLIDDEGDNQGKIIENNQLILSAYISEEGGIPLTMGIIPDDHKKIKQAIIQILEKSDALFITGGTSVGKKDLIPNIINDLGELVVHGISMKPGKPTGLAIINNKPLILMPGYPVACIIAFYVFGRPLIRRLLNLEKPLLDHKINAKLTKRAPSMAGRTDFLRVFVQKQDEEYIVTPIRASGSGILSSMVRANGLLEIPEFKEGYEKGEIVSVFLIKNQIPGV